MTDAKELLIAAFADLVDEVILYATDKRTGNKDFWDKEALRRKAEFKKFGKALLEYRELQSYEGNAWLETIAERLSDMVECLDCIAANKPDGGT